MFGWLRAATAGLALEAFAALGSAAKARGQDLDGDVPFEPRIVGEVDLSHPAAPERLG